LSTFMIYVYLYNKWRSKVSLHIDFYGIVTAKAYERI
jgi:hypothetical protein